MPAKLRRLRTEELSASELHELRALFDEAWQGDDAFDDDDWAHTVGGTHFIIEVSNTVRSHVSVVPRTLVTSGRALRTGYVEAVATRERDRRRGYASELMRAATDLIDERYELGARDGALRLLRPFRVGTLARADLDAPISCNWRPGDVW